jgi:peptide/nickel transport system ATP-binding protein
VTALLELRGVTKVFSGGFFSRVPPLYALEDVSFSIPEDRPSITAIAGESGSGKTTLARILLGILSPTQGEVLYRGKPVSQMAGAERKQFRREIQPIFQDPFESYNPFYKVDHVLTTPARNFKIGRNRAEVNSKIEEALHAVGLQPEETLGRFPHQLSGGQRQRVMVARALLLRPRIILADEPVSMVDASLRATILDSVYTLNRQHGISVVYITHDLTTAYQISDNIIVLYRGSVTEAGSVETVIKKPQHPYTQLLVQSIPLPDPEKLWGELAARGDEHDGTIGGCKFASRCPHVLDICRSSRPVLYQIEQHRVASCFRYRDSPALAEGDITTVFASPAVEARA